MALSLIDNRNQIEVLASSLNEVTASLAEMDTPELVDTFLAADPMTKAVKALEDTAKMLLRERRNEGGADDKGHRYLSGTRGGSVKIERRLTIAVADDALDVLQEKGVVDLLPKTPNPQKMLAKLQELGVDPSEYSDPVVTKDAIEALVGAGVIDTDTALRLVTQSETFAVKPQKAK